MEAVGQLPAAAAPVGGGSASRLDEQGLEVQQHAAAVQLLNRSLAVAHLRAELAMPRGGALAVARRAARVAVKQEPGAAPPEQPQGEQRQPTLPWHAPQQPPAQAAATGDLQAIAIQVNSTAKQLPQPEAQQQPQPPPLQQARRSHQARSRQLVHRAADPLAAQRFQADEPPPAHDDEGAAGAAAGPAAAAAQPAAPAPRIVANPSMLPQQLAGWVRLGPDGLPEAGPDADAGAAAERGGEDLTHGDLAGAAAGAGAEQPQEDLMDEEEWV